jgi:hypothetical protein
VGGNFHFDIGQIPAAQPFAGMRSGAFTPLSASRTPLDRDKFFEVHRLNNGVRSTQVDDINFGELAVYSQDKVNPLTTLDAHVLAFYWDMHIIPRSSCSVDTCLGRDKLPQGAHSGN